MRFSTRLVRTHSGVAAVLAALSFATLAAAYIAEYGFGLAPCQLCLYQRWPYAAVILLGLAALLLRRYGRKLQRLALWLSVVALLVGGSIAVYHTGVEQGIFEGPGSCAEEDAGEEISLEELRKKILGAQVVRCDKPAVELWGVVTMASANMLWSFLLAAWGLRSLSRNQDEGSSAISQAGGR